MNAGGAKKKGNNGERKFALWLSMNGIKSSRDPGSGGGNREKSDIVNNINANFEVKTVKKLNLKEAWKQTEIAASKTHNTPYLIIHFDGMRDNEWLVVMNNHEWMDMYKTSKEPKTISESTKYLGLKLANAKRAITELIHELEK